MMQLTQTVGPATRIVVWATRGRLTTKIHNLIDGRGLTIELIPASASLAIARGGGYARAPA
jgi:hypothetical protein